MISRWPIVNARTHRRRPTAALTLALGALGWLCIFVSGPAAGETSRVFFGHVTSGGEPVVGAMVRAQGIDWRHREVSDAAARTDADGRFVLLGLGDHAVEIRVTAPWYPAFALDLPPDVPSSVLVIRRVPRGVAGRVIEPTSEKPIEGVRVRGGGGEAG